MDDGFRLSLPERHIQRLEQATGLFSALGVSCDVVVTDGIRYRMYEASKDFAPVAYANLIYLGQQ